MIRISIVVVCRYQFASRYKPGSLLRDYHTTQVPPKVAVERYHAPTRKDELAASEKISSRNI
jgi:hypothetical protein